MDAYCRHAKIAADSTTAKNQRKNLEEGISSAFAMNGAIFVYVGDGWLKRTPNYQKQTLIHEYFHAMQSTLAKGKTLLPKWLVEGSTEYSAYQVTIKLNFYTEEGTDEYYHDRLWGLNSPLSSVETSDEVRL